MAAEPLSPQKVIKIYPIKKIQKRETRKNCHSHQFSASPPPPPQRPKRAPDPPRTGLGGRLEEGGQQPVVLEEVGVPLQTYSLLLLGVQILHPLLHLLLLPLDPPHLASRAPTKNNSDVLP